jgi:hypothetical protein
VPKFKLVAVQLETCHANHDATAWYAYYNGPVGYHLRDEVEAAAKKDGAPLGLDFEADSVEEVPNALSKHAGLKRYYVGGAV